MLGDALDKENAAREVAGQPTKPTKFETDKAKLCRTIRTALSTAASFEDFSQRLLQEGVTVKETTRNHRRLVRRVATDAHAVIIGFFIPSPLSEHHGAARVFIAIQEFKI